MVVSIYAQIIWHVGLNVWGYARLNRSEGDLGLIRAVLNYSTWYMYCFLYWMRPISSSYKPHVAFLFRSFLCSLVIDAFPSYYLALQFQFLGAYNPRVCDT